MAKIELTAQQRMAVEQTGGTLLVSAAAGSGKTKVLVDRLLRQVCAPETPCNVDDFLIITYTRAAAAELRGKITAALLARLAETPEDLHLQRQLQRIYLAQISTVHAFCAELLRQYAVRLSLPVDFRVVEESDCAQLRTAAVERVLAETYEDLPNRPAARCFLDTLGAGRSDQRAAAWILQTYDKAICQPAPMQWLEDCCRSQGDTPEQTAWGQLLLTAYRQTITQQQTILRAALAQLETEPGLQEKYAPAFHDDLAQLARLADASEWDAIYQLRDVQFTKLGAAGKATDPVLREQCKAVRKAEKEALGRLFEIFSVPAAEAMQTQAQCREAICGLVDLTRRFAVCYRQEKRRRKWLDFSDLEQETRRLLCGSGDRPTAVAREVAQRYREIMVDEYQDSNRLQDSIFFAISKQGRNVFLVGDVKQSIYRFRLADPTIFLEKYRAYPHAGQAEADAPRKVLLTQNFRSRAEILEAANDICRMTMSKAVGDVDYTAAEALRYGRNLEEPTQQAVELHCINLDYGEAAHPDKRDAEAAWVAQRIAQLLTSPHFIATPDGPRRVQPGDIVILLSTLRAVAPAYVHALQQRGIPVSCEQEGDLLACPEVTQMLSLLQVIDNPHQDLALYGALASPLFGFTADEIARARVGRRQGDLYSCLLAYAPEDEKTAQFLQRLQVWRQMAAQKPVDQLLAALYTELEVMGVFGAMSAGTARTENLQDLFCMAADAVQAGNNFLHGFLRQLEGRAAQGIPRRPRTGEDGSVRIMSIHKSKGLEFPVVILAGLAKKFNIQDMTAPVLLHPQLGVAVNYVDLQQRVQYPSAAKRAMALQLRRELVSEQLRVLYVALTRARDLLIMTYAQAGLEKQLAQLVWQLEWMPREALSASAARLGHWVLLHAMQRVEAGQLFACAGRPQQLYTAEHPWKICLHDGQAVLDALRTAQPEPVQPAAVPQTPLPLSAQALREWMAFSYPDAPLSQVPSKITATQLKGRFLDQELEPAPPAPLRKARFQAGSQPLRPAEVGTATHLAMQFLRYENCRTLEGVQAEIAWLVEKAYLTPEQAAVVSAEKIYRLFAGPLGRRILDAPRCVREFKFSVLTDAGQYFPQAAGQSLMLQGVTDCCLLTASGLTVIDFKTDHVTPATQEKTAQYYKGQLETYAKALGEIFDLSVQEKILYFFATDQAVSV